jgi:hypothetical protein
MRCPSMTPFRRSCRVAPRGAALVTGAGPSLVRCCRSQGNNGESLTGLSASSKQASARVFGHGPIPCALITAVHSASQNSSNFSCVRTRVRAYGGSKRDVGLDPGGWSQ